MSHTSGVRRSIIFFALRTVNAVYFLPLLLGLFRGKGIIFLLVIGVGAYFLLGRGGCGRGCLAAALDRADGGGRGGAGTR